jgi:hypothetical protein
MRPWLGIVLVLCLGGLPLVARGDTQELPPWEKFDERDGIAIFRRDIPGSPIVALRGEGVVDAPLLRVASVIFDASRAAEWIDSMVEARTIRDISPVERVIWTHIGTPFLLDDRDFVYSGKFTAVPRRKQLRLDYRSVVDPLAPKTKYVRGEFTYGVFSLTSIARGTKTFVVAEVMCDPKGSVAKWVVNLFQRSWPYNTIGALRAQARKTNIQEHAGLRAFVEANSDFR